MPEMKYYTITQTRQVEVVANSLEDAVTIAELAFEHGQNVDNGVKNNPIVEAKLKGIWGNTRSKIKAMNLMVERKS